MQAGTTPEQALETETHSFLCIIVCAGNGKEKRRSLNPNLQSSGSFQTQTCQRLLHHGRINYQASAVSLHVFQFVERPEQP
jgi:hypothetical protein